MEYFCIVPHPVDLYHTKCTLRYTEVGHTVRVATAMVSATSDSVPPPTRCRLCGAPDPVIYTDDADPSTHRISPVGLARICSAVLSILLDLYSLAQPANEVPND